MYYANYSTKLVKRNFNLHNPDSPLLVGNVNENDVVKEVREPSYIDMQQKLIWYYDNSQVENNADY